jgi:UDP:flavonoid glycosyltransferase YjiC (YdhE family)
MSRFLIVTWDGAGNLVSTLAIARRLAQRGHDVRLLGHQSIDDRCGSHGWSFRPLVHTPDFDSSKPMDLDTEVAILSRALWFNAGVATDVQEELEREPADVVVADCMLTGALSAAQAAGLPAVALFHTPYAGLRGGPLVDMLAPGVPLLNELRDDLGLPPVTGMADVHDACSLCLVCTPREFEIDLPHPANVRFVGPILDGPALSTEIDDVDLPRADKPLVLVSFSTSYQGQLDAVQRVVAALDRLEVDAVVTTGTALAPDAVAAPANVTVVRFADHRRLLPAASIVVTHAGLGTVMNALSHGVPTLCMPMGRDQFFNAAMVERLGAGRVVDMNADEATIAASVRALLDDPAARDAAAGVASVIARYAGGADAERELERLAAERQPMTTST